MSAPLAVDLSGITKSFGSVVAAKAVDFKVKQAEIHALLGENGAGKSTLMSVLFGLYQPDNGEIRLHGQLARLRSPQDAARHGVGMVHQNFRLVENLTALENIMLGESSSLWRGRRWRAEKGQELEALADRFRLRFPVHRPVWQLSVGERQRVEIVKTLYRNSDIIVLDEPTSVLTPQEADDLYETLQQLKANGKTVIVTTHKLREVMQACDHISIMRRGCMVASLSRSETNENDLARLVMGSDPVAAVRNTTTHKKGRLLLSLNHLQAKGDHGQLALKDIDLQVHKGEIVGVAGVSGNGQSELAEVITGMRPWTGGSLVFNDKKITRPSIKNMIRRGVAHVPENRMQTGMAGSLDVTDNLLMKQYSKAEHSRYGFIRERANRLWSKKLVDSYQVATPSISTQVRQLSGGNQQKLLLARELEANPALLVAMHPTQGLDVGSAASVHHLLLKLRSKGGAVLLLSEDLDEILKIADRVVVIFDGRINAELTPSKVDREHIGLCMTGMQTELETG
jgi:ABC-type uncharacterized transport system ATPase subunit